MNTLLYLSKYLSSVKNKMRHFKILEDICINIDSNRGAPSQKWLKARSSHRSYEQDIYTENAESKQGNYLIDYNLSLVGCL